MTAKQLHAFVKCYNWDEGDEPMHDVARHLKCDLGTALMIYWVAEPTYWFVKYATRKEVPRKERPGFDFLLEIEDRVASGFYKSHRIKFDPGDLDGDDRTQLQPGDKWKRRVPKAMYGPHYSGPKPRPKPISIKRIKTMNSQELHHYVMTTLWDQEGAHIQAVLNSSQCDRGTALLVYWHSAPFAFANYGSTTEVDDVSKPAYMFITKLERRLVTGHYKRNKIRFNPQNDRGTDWTRDNYHLPKNRNIPRELFDPNID